MSHRRRYAAEETVLRAYNHETDFSSVNNICQGIISGIEQVPSALEIYDRTTCNHPMVLCLQTGIVAFANARVMAVKDTNLHLVYIESVRVAKQEQRRGLGTIIIKSIMRKMMPVEGEVRFFATTLAKASPVVTIFEHAGYDLHALVHQWPSTEFLYVMKERGAVCAKHLLEMIGGLEQLSQEVRNSTKLWQKLTHEDEIAQCLSELSSMRGSPDVIMKRYAVDSTGDRISFLQSEWAVLENRSVWTLQRNGKPPALLFVRSKSADLSNPFVFSEAVAVMVDREAAEMSVAFLSSLHWLGLYSIVFDSAISAELIKSSPLLSKIGTSPFWVHRTIRTVHLNE